MRDSRSKVTALWFGSVNFLDPVIEISLALMG
jgi:hypothetical protein